MGRPGLLDARYRTGGARPAGGGLVVMPRHGDDQAYRSRRAVRMLRGRSGSVLSKRSRRVLHRTPFAGFEVVDGRVVTALGGKPEQLLGLTTGHVQVRGSAFKPVKGIGRVTLEDAREAAAGGWRHQTEMVPGKHLDHRRGEFGDRS